MLTPHDMPRVLDRENEPKVRGVMMIFDIPSRWVNGAHEDWIECIRNGGPVPADRGSEK